MFLLVVSVCVAYAQNSFYHFRMVVTHATFSVLAVAAFVVSRNIPTADCTSGETVIVVKGNNSLSRHHN